MGNEGRMLGGLIFFPKSGRFGDVINEVVKLCCKRSMTFSLLTIFFVEVIAKMAAFFEVEYNNQILVKFY